MLSLLDAVERDGGRSQRGLAADLNIAVGLVNAYLARCMRKGLIKAREVPARRYFYYLTPRGFTEKSQLTVQYLRSSFGFFREAKQDCLGLFAAARKQGLTRLVLAGRSELAEIAAICTDDSGVEIVAVVDPEGGRFLGRRVHTSFDKIDVAFDAVVVTDLMNGHRTCDLALARYGAARVLVPETLRVRLHSRRSPAP